MALLAQGFCFRRAAPSQPGEAASRTPSANPEGPGPFFSFPRACWPILLPSYAHLGGWIENVIQGNKTPLSPGPGPAAKQPVAKKKVRCAVTLSVKGHPWRHARETENIYPLPVPGGAEKSPSTPVLTLWAHMSRKKLSLFGPQTSESLDHTLHDDSFSLNCWKSTTSPSYSCSPPRLGPAGERLGSHFFSWESAQESGLFTGQISRQAPKT